MRSASRMYQTLVTMGRTANPDPSTRKNAQTTIKARQIQNQGLFQSFRINPSFRVSKCGQLCTAFNSAAVKGKEQVGSNDDNCPAPTPTPGRFLQSLFINDGFACQTEQCQQCVPEVGSAHFSRQPQHRIRHQIEANT